MMEWYAAMKKITTLLIVIFLLLGFPIHSQAQSLSATLSAGSGSGLPGSSGININVNLSSSAGTDVAGINFDLGFDASRITVDNVSIGSAASSAGKNLAWSSPSNGKVRIIVFGLNQTAISNGTVATLSVSVLTSAAPGSFSLSLSNADATDPAGNSISLSLNAGSFTVNAPPPPPATATDTSAPPTSTATATSMPKSLPSFTPTSTHTSQPTSTRTPTTQPGNTTVPSSTNALPATPTRTATRTGTPTATLASGTSTQTSPTETRNPSETEVEAFAKSPSPTPTVNSGVDPGTPNSQSALDPILAEASNDPLEAAVAATSTALAMTDNSPEDQRGAGLTGSDPEGPLAGSNVDMLSVLNENIQVISTIFLVAGITGVVTITPFAVYLVRRRSAKLKYGRISQSPVAYEGSPNRSSHLRK